MKGLTIKGEVQLCDICRREMERTTDWKGRCNNCKEFRCECGRCEMIVGLWHEAGCVSFINMECDCSGPFRYCPDCRSYAINKKTFEQQAIEYVSSLQTKNISTIIKTVQELLSYIVIEDGIPGYNEDHGLWVALEEARCLLSEYGYQVVKVDGNNEILGRR